MSSGLVSVSRNTHKYSNEPIQSSNLKVCAHLLKCVLRLGKTKSLLVKMDPGFVFKGIKISEMD